MSEWKKVCLGDLVTIRTGKRDANFGSPDGAYPFFTCARQISRCQSYSFDCDAILLAGNCDISNMQRYCGKFEAYQRTYVLTNKDDSISDLDYIWNCLRRDWVKVTLGKMLGAAIQYIKLGMIKEFPIALPPLSTQKRIADILSAYDDLIENNRRRMEILEESARLIFKERFEDVWERGKLPRGWRTCCVPDCIEVEPEVANPHCDEIRYIPMAALSTSGMTIDVAKAEMRTKAASVRFANGDVLLAGITPCLENGKTGFVNFLDKNEIACGSTEFIVLRGRTVSPYFTYCLSRTERFRETAIKSMVGASGRQRVQPECFNTYEIALPTTTILREFDELVEPMFEQIGLLVKQNQDLAEARDMLLPKLMTQT